MATATFIRNLDGFSGDAALYSTDDRGHLVASAVVAYSGPETLVFPATEDGEIASWLEVGGGRGYLDHETALRDMGYQIGNPSTSTPQ